MSRTVILKLTVDDHVKVVSGGNDVFITSDNYSGFTGFCFEMMSMRKWLQFICGQSDGPAWLYPACSSTFGL